MKFEEAVAAMREGKKVRKSYWGKEYWIKKDGAMVLDQSGEEWSGEDGLFDDLWQIYEKPKWRPVSGDWWIDSEGYVWEGRPDICSAEFGTERKTRGQAEKACDKMREFNRLLAYVDEYAPDWEPCWGGGSYNYYVYYYSETGRYTCAAATCTKRLGTVYMPKDVALRLVDDLNSGRVEL